MLQGQGGQVGGVAEIAGDADLHEQVLQDRPVLLSRRQNLHQRMLDPALHQLEGHIQDKRLLQQPGLRGDPLRRDHHLPGEGDAFIPAERILQPDAAGMVMGHVSKACLGGGRLGPLRTLKGCFQLLAQLRRQLRPGEVEMVVE